MSTNIQKYLEAKQQVAHFQERVKAFTKKRDKFLHTAIEEEYQKFNLGSETMKFLKKHLYWANGKFKLFFTPPQEEFSSNSASSKDKKWLKAFLENTSNNLQDNDFCDLFIIEGSQLNVAWGDFSEVLFPRDIKITVIAQPS